MTGAVNSRTGHWSAYLKPQAAGGNFSIVAAAPAFNASALRSATFGDIYFCSGALLNVPPSHHHHPTDTRPHSFALARAGQRHIAP